MPNSVVLPQNVWPLITSTQDGLKLKETMEKEHLSTMASSLHFRWTTKGGFPKAFKSNDLFIQIFIGLRLKNFTWKQIKSIKSY